MYQVKSDRKRQHAAVDITAGLCIGLRTDLYLPVYDSLFIHRKYACVCVSVLKKIW